MVRGRSDYVDVGGVSPSNCIPVDCTNSKLTYVGSWTLVSDDFDSQNGTYKYSSTLNDSVSLTFYGIGVRIRFRRASDAGKVSITIDTTTRTVNTYNDTVDHRWFTFLAETKENHLLTIKVAESGKRVYFDSLTILQEEKALDTVSIIQEIVNTQSNISKFLGRTDYGQMTDLYPASVIYYSGPTAKSDGKAGLALADEYHRILAKPLGSENLVFKQKASTGELQSDLVSWGGTAVSIGQQVAAASIPVVQASDKGLKSFEQERVEAGYGFGCLTYRLGQASGTYQPTGLLINPSGSGRKVIITLIDCNASVVTAVQNSTYANVTTSDNGTQVIAVNRLVGSAVTPVALTYRTPTISVGGTRLHLIAGYISARYDKPIIVNPGKNLMFEGSQFSGSAQDVRVTIEWIEVSI